MDTKDSEVVVALLFKENYGPNDELLNQHDGKAYWISSMRYKGAGWQTAVFDRTRFLWLSRPLFRVNEMDNPLYALDNHFITILMVAESPPESWPKGMHWTRPEEPSWLEAQAKVWKEWPSPLSMNRNNPDLLEQLRPLIDFYSILRRRYNCVRPPPGQ